MKKKKKHNDNLRLVVMNEDTFEEKYAFRLNVKNLYIAISSILAVLFIIIFLIIAYTPLRHLVPGYASIENNTYVIKLNKHINELENQIATQEQYNKALRKILVDNDTTGIAIAGLNAGYTPDENASGTKTTAKAPQPQANKGNIDLSIPEIISPLPGNINKKIDIKSRHYGVDFAGTMNTPVRAVLDGTVIFSDWTTETGNTIILQHPGGLISVYKHNSSLFKETGDYVHKGEVIAKLGNSGTLTTGPHLHFELWKKGIPLDPLKYIKK